MLEAAVCAGSPCYYRHYLFCFLKRIRRPGEGLCRAHRFVALPPRVWFICKQSDKSKCVSSGYPIIRTGLFFFASGKVFAVWLRWKQSQFVFVALELEHGCSFQDFPGKNMRMGTCLMCTGVPLGHVEPSARALHTQPVHARHL